MNTLLHRTESLLGRILEVILVVTFSLIFVLVATLVGLRYFLNSSITGGNEIVIVLFVYTTALGGALAAGRGEHIAIRVVPDRLSPRLRRAADGIVLLLVAGINAAMAAFSLQWIAITGDYLMPSTGLPRRVAQASVPIGCGLAVCYCLLAALRALTTRSGGS